LGATGLAATGLGATGLDPIAVDVVGWSVSLEAEALAGVSEGVALASAGSPRALLSVPVSSRNGSRKMAATAPRAKTLRTIPSHNILEPRASGAAWLCAVGAVAPGIIIG